MLAEIILFMILGIFAGALTGLTPGIHINLVGAILVGLSATILSGMNPIFLIVFIASMAIAHTFLDFVPSIFLGCPDTETQLSILPGHELLKEGHGYEAVMLTAYGGIIACFLLIIIAFPSAIFISKIYNTLQLIMPWILIIASFILIMTEKRKLTALFIFLISGILGLCVLNMNLKEPLLPLLSGLFGSSMLVISIKTKIKIPPQEITRPEKKFFGPIIGSILASPLCGFLPGLGSSQAAILGNTISRTDRKGFLIIVGAVNILVMGFSFVSLYAISKTRTGAAAAIKELIGTIDWKILIVLLFCVLISGIVSFYLSKIAAKIFSKRITKVNYTYLSLGILVLLAIIILIFSGLIGEIIFIVSTLTGVYCNSFNIRKTNMMGCLLIPTIILYLF